MEASSSDSEPSQLSQETGKSIDEHVGSPRAALASIDLNPLPSPSAKLHQPIPGDDEDDPEASDSLEKTVKELPSSDLGPQPHSAASINEELPDEPPTPTTSALPFSAGPAGDKPELPSPSDSSSSSIRDSTLTLSRQASITSASSRLSAEVDSPTRSSSTGYVFGPRRSLGTRSAADKISPISSSVDAGPSAYPRLTRAPTRKRMSLGYVSSPSNAESSSAGTAAGLPPTPTSANSRSGFPRASVRPSPVGYRVPFPTTPAPVSPQPNGPSTPEASASSGVVDHSQDGKTVMDMSRELLAEIASRERRVGELREELKKEEKALQSLQAQWQSCVARDMPATQQQQIKTEDASALANQNQIPVGVMDAVKGFSARLPSGLGSQLNALVDGLNTGSSPSKSPTNGSPLVGLGALNEEGEDLLADQRNYASSLSGTTAGGASSPESVRSSRSAANQQGASLFGSLTALRESIEETLRIPDEQGGQATLAAGSSSTSSSSSKTENTGGWSQWSKRLKDVASRAEKALGDAMTVDGLAEAVKQSNSSSVASSSRSPRKDSVSLDDENEREKAALADLSWFGTLNNAPNQIMVTSPSLGFDPEHSPTKPRQLTPEQLLALSEADGLVPDPGARPMPRRSDSAMSSASSSSSSMRQQKSTSTTTTNAPAAKRQSSLPKGSFPVAVNGGGEKKRQSTILGFMPWGASAAEKDNASTAAGTTRETPTRRPTIQKTPSTQSKSALQSRLQNATTNAGIKSPEIAGSSSSSGSGNGLSAVEIPTD